MNTETRTIELFGAVEPLEIRAESGKPTIVGGYAARFNVRSKDLGGFQEIILPGAFAVSLTSTRDVLALASHDIDKLLARTANKTLRVWEDQKGLRFEAQMPDTSYARDLLALMQRGDIVGCSFGFICPPGGDSFTEEGPTIVRTVRTADLYEVSIVAMPAYDATSVAVRVDPTVMSRAKAPAPCPVREAAARKLKIARATSR